MNTAENSLQTAVIGRPFTPGVSGNPNGRPSTKALIAALKPLEQSAYDAIRDGLKCDDIRIRCENAWKLIERIYGKPEAMKNTPEWLDEKIVEMLS